MAEKIKHEWAEAQKHFAGGVNSPVRAFRSVGGQPVFMERAQGAYLYDTDGHAYIDYCLSWGAVIHGHAYEPSAEAVRRQVSRGSSFGTVTPYETALAREIKKAFPGMEKMRFTSSGTEAVMSAIRLARGCTGRERIVKFEGGYHGHADSLLVKAGSGLATFGHPDSAGVPKKLAELTTVLPYNDTRSLKEFFRRTKDVAAVILEPIAANMGVVPAERGFLRELRAVTEENRAFLIFDEVITGYRVGYGGAQHLFGVKPDLTILGKIIGGGLPIGAFGGRSKIMDRLSPAGDVYQAGTLSGNPLSMVSGLAALSGLSADFYRVLEKNSAGFLKALSSVLKKRSARVQSVGSMFTVFFARRAVKNFKDSLGTNKREYARFFHHLLKNGIYVPPSAYEAFFVSAAHGESEFERTLDAVRRF